MILISHLMNCLVRLMHLDQVVIEEGEAVQVLRDQWALQVHLVIQAHPVFLETLDLLDLNRIYNHSLIKFKRLKVDKKGLRRILSLTCKLKLGLWVQEDLQVSISYSS